MKSLDVQRALVSLLWGLSLIPYFRWWGVTLGMPGFALWTMLYVLCYLATAILFLDPSQPDRHRSVRNQILIWVGLVVVAFITQRVFPQITLAGNPVQTGYFVHALEFVVPCWIIARAVFLLWERTAMRVVMLTVGPSAVLAALTAYMIAMPSASYSGPLPPLTETEAERSRRLQAAVTTLAGDIGERNHAFDARLEDAVRFIDNTLASFGYSVAYQRFDDGPATYTNVEVVLEGHARPDEIVIVGGHYDSVEGTPGADDNASGTAVMLELARLLRNEAFPRTIRFVAFANEEPPFFGTDRMGSAHYAARSANMDENIVAMISLETVGYFVDDPKSQGYPPPFNFFYPDVGNFIGFVGNLPSRGLVRRSLAMFRGAVQFPSEGVAAPEQIPGVWWSDHSPFWTHGFKAIMITDTAPFRNPHYHQSTDTPDRLDYDRMARVVTGVAAVVRDLASGG